MIKQRILLLIIYSILYQTYNLKIHQKQINLKNNITDTIICSDKNVGMYFIILENGEIIKMVKNKEKRNIIKEYFKETKINEKPILFKEEENSDIFIIYYKNKILKTDDCGKTFIIEKIDFIPEKIEFKKDDEINLLIKSKTNDLYISEDFGKNWILLQNKISDFNFLPTIIKNWILFTNKKNEKNNLFIINTKRDISLKLENIKNFILIKDYLYVLKEDEKTQNRVLLKIDIMKNFEIKNTKIENKKLDDIKSYSFFPANNNQIFLYTKIKDEFYDMGNLYISDEKGIFFRLIKKNVLHDNGNKSFDIFNVKGYKGNFIINGYDDNSMEILKDSHFLGLWSLMKKSFITFDKGKNWEYLVAPLYDRKNKKIICDEICFLNLHLNSSENVTQLYSIDKMGGFVISQGNIGNFLDNKKENNYLFSTFDGGRTWQEIKKGEFIYELGDYGYIILLSKKNVKINELEYSLDKGKTFKKIKLENEIFIDNIIINDNNFGHFFIILGKSNKDKKTDIIIEIDLDLFTSICKNKMDYGFENDFSIIKSLGDNCYFGEKYFFKEKKNYFCELKFDYSYSYSKEKCICELSDFECPFNYIFKTVNSNVCILKDLENRDGKKIMEFPIKIPGNKCKEQYFVFPYKLFLFCLLFIIFFIGFILYDKNQDEKKIKRNVIKEIEILRSKIKYENT